MGFVLNDKKSNNRSYTCLDHSRNVDAQSNISLKAKFSIFMWDRPLSIGTHADCCLRPFSRHNQSRQLAVYVYRGREKERPWTQTSTSRVFPPTILTVLIYNGKCIPDNLVSLYVLNTMCVCTPTAGNVIGVHDRIDIDKWIFNAKSFALPSFIPKAVMPESKNKTSIVRRDAVMGKWRKTIERSLFFDEHITKPWLPIIKRIQVG